MHKSESLKGTLLTCGGLILGALGLRFFVLRPIRRIVPVKSSQYEFQRQPIHQHVQTTSMNLGVPSSESKGRHFLPINPTGTLSNDILAIEHVPDESAIHVQFRSNGRCVNPYLRGRLSGPTLSILEWTTPTRKNTKVGRYQVPIPGPYFVEIIAITCNDFSYNTSYDFQFTCIEDVMNHRLTKTNTQIVIDSADTTSAGTAAANNNAAARFTGYWLHQPDERARQQDFASVYTRFQPRGCRRIDDPTHEDYENPPMHCIQPTDLNRFEPYLNHFQYYEYNYFQGKQQQEQQQEGWQPVSLLPDGASKLTALSPTTICLVGASHSRTIKASIDNYHNITMANNNIHVEWINVKFPRNLNNKTLPELKKKKCDKLIVGIGQWPASFTGKKPTLFLDYDFQFRRLLMRLQTFLDPSVEIWARSIHYNPLNVMNSAYCPPRDWRSPPVLDGYNAIIRQACHDAQNSSSSDATGKEALPRVRFVDTNFIVGPLWDASSDWGHVCPQASHVEALYLLAVAIGLVEQAV